ncbi:MAG: DegT/DnrJ/EryC1/StrS family aminotransferase, partial [Ferruginibacter sp.]|nr:DegT/DnrJ/EryC1/StrS family aminotransferase [Ferruginibacter sp.]
TPFSYVATTASIVWEGCTPVFVDIDPLYLTIDENKIESSITSKTTCILATHVFGNPCNIEVIQSIAEKHGLKVIYDAAHCFGVKYKDRSIFEYGDISTCSFHGTKLFHTGEGGAIFCMNSDLMNRIYYTHNFGHNGPQDFHGLGINGKISELQSAMGLSVLSHIDEILYEREKLCNKYSSLLNKKNIQVLKIREGTVWNFSYYPIVFKSEANLLLAEHKLKEVGIFARRYFYPSLNKLNYVNSASMNTSESISSRILCLPLFIGLSDNDIFRVIKIINSL